MDDLRAVIETALCDEMRRNNIEPPDKIADETVLLETGLDSLAFATLVVRLEERLGYDPFQLMAEPFYPETFGEFVAVYARYAEHRKDDV